MRRVGFGISSRGVTRSNYLLTELGAKDAKNLFTALRKAANHPLLLRVHYTNEAILDQITQAAMNASHFGTYCDFDRAKEEILEKFNDFDIHQLC